MSFRLKTILGVAAIEAVLLTLLVWSGLRFIEHSAEQEFTQRAQATARAFAVTTKNALIASDLAALQSFVQEALSYPGVLYARVRDAQGRELASAGTPAMLTQPFNADHHFADTADGVFDAAGAISEAGMPFGRVELGLSAQALQALESEARHYGIGLALLEMVLVALFSLALGVYLTRQLHNIATGSQRLAAGELGYQIPVQGDDELAETARSFNLMSARVREAYAELAERETHWRRILENIQDGILILDHAGHITECSPAAATLFACPAGQLRGIGVSQLFSATSWNTVRAMLEAPDPAQTSTLCETEGQRLDGSCFPLEIHLTPLDGDQDSVLMVVRDISARIAAEADLRLRNRIIEDSSNGVVIADATRPDQPILYVNRAFTRITGYSAAEVLGRNCQFLQGPNTERDMLDALRRALRECSDVQVILRNYTKDGREFWNELSISPIRNGRGEVTHFVALQNDISDRIAAQRQLVARENYLRRVLNSTHDAIIVIDAQGLIESFNTGAEVMFGYSAAEMIGQNVSLLVPEPHRTQHDHYLRRYREGGNAVILGIEREFEAQRKDGSSFSMALRVNEMQEEGQLRFIGVIHDISVRKCAEDVLREAKEAAEAAAEAKTQFLANMSHEIRTPMHGVLGALEMLRDSPLSTVQQRYLNTASTSAEILLTLIDEILDFSRLEAGKLHIENLDFELRRTVEDVTAMLGQHAHAKHIELACFIAPDTPDLLQGDPIRLRQVLTNLIGNAVKFTEKGEVVVNVTVEPEIPLTRGVMLRFEVRDTGIGIAIDKQPLLFEPFVQADGSTSRRFGGSGLGLSIARRLVELMGGTIGLDSAPGRGSRFWFRLPFAVATPKEARLRADFSGQRILIVDDNATNRIILHRYLTAWQVQPGSAAGGEEALAKLQDAASAGRPYHVALLDCNMPDMDGLRLARCIKTDPALTATRVLMLSSSSQETAVIAELGIDIWLDKPVRQLDLHDAIATVLNRDNHHRAPVEPVSRRHDEGPRFAGERVLLVEDNPISQELGRMMLRQRNLRVNIANNGLEAIAAARQQPYAVIFMDVQMPEMDGYAATREIRAREAATGQARVPIIALTAHALPSDQKKCLDAGMDDYLTKPYSGSSLAAMVARWLTRPAGQVPSEFDPAKLTEVKKLMGVHFSALLTKFISTLDTQLQQAQAARASSNRERLLDAVHSLKNTAGDIGAAHLHAVATTLETRLKQGEFPSGDLATLDTVARAAMAAATRQLEQEITK